MVPSSPSPRVSGPCPPSSSLTHSSSSSSHSSHSHSHSHSHSANSGSESSSASSSPSTSPLEQLRTIKTNPEHHKHDTGKQNTTTHQTRRLSVEPLTSTPLIDKPTASSANPPQPTKMTESIRLASQHRLEQEPFIEEEGESERYRVPSPSSGQIDIKNHRYPFCLVWGPLPLISWIFPWIGHLGIADSEGKVHDFAGPYYIGIDSFMTPIFKYYQFPREVWYGKEAAWNAGVVQADSEYRKLMHNICCQNCHHHTARALSNMTLGPNHLPQFTMMSAWWLITRKGKFVSWPAWLCTYMPLICGVALILAIALWSS